MAFGMNFELMFRLLVRAVHLISTMLMLTILVLECFFHFEKNAALYEDANFKRMVTGNGVAMIVSGILLTHQMSKSDALPS